MEQVNKLLNGVEIPDMAQVRQNFSAPVLDDPCGTLKQQLDRPEIRNLVKPGMKIAVTVGSRGIAEYIPLLRCILDSLKEMGAEPFLIPAMGSHGGASAEGQKKLLAGYGITEESVGVPIRATMEVVAVDQTDSGETVWVDRYAKEADGIVLFNRIKPHTGFRGDYESGLVKMAAIGLGKQKGAETVHDGGPAMMASRVREFGCRAIRAVNVLFGVGTVENAYEKVRMVRALTRDEIFTEEPEMLAVAKSGMPCIMFEHLDVLIVDQIGKNISGPGMDPNITHTYLPGAEISEELRAKRATRVVIFDLTEETHGAAMGIGMSDITTKRLFEKMNLDTTYPNCLTGGVTVSAKIPMMFDSQKLAIQAAIKTLNGADLEHLRIVRLKDTLHTEYIEISEALMQEARENPEVEIVSEPAPLVFDEDGNLF